MRRKHRVRNCGIVLLLIAGCIKPGPTPTPAPTPDTPSSTFGFEVSIPPTMPNRSDALQLAAVCDEYARQIELDGKQPEPVIVTTKDLETRNAKMQAYAFGGRAIATSGFVEAVNAVQEREFPQGEDAVPVTPEMRQKAVDFYRAIAFGLRQVQ